jgi:excisionase family DNA binding protein
MDGTNECLRPALWSACNSLNSLGKTRAKIKTNWKGKRVSYAGRGFMATLFFWRHSATQTWREASPMIKAAHMNREEAAEELGISVRSLQRTVKAGKLGVTYRRGDSGKQEAVFDADEIARHKADMQSETILPAILPTQETTQALARIADLPMQLASVLEHLQIAATARDTDLARSVADAVRESFQPETQLTEIAAKPLLKLDEASKLTGLSRAILREAIDSKKLKAKIIGRAWRIKRSDLDAYVNKL